MKFPSAAVVLFSLAIGSCQGNEELSSSASAQRQLMFEKIWTYEPRTKITDIAAIDQDLFAITRELRKMNFESAERIYREGGHSGSTAKLNLGTALKRSIPAGTEVIGPRYFDDEEGSARGFLASDARMGDEEIFVTYETSAVQDNHVACQVGALQDTLTTGCFASSGDILLPNTQESYNYTYDVNTDNNNFRTIYDLNLNAKKWSDTPTFFKFMEYYGTDNFLDEIISAAFDFKETEMFRGNMDFSVYQEKGNKEIVDFAIPVMTMFLSSIGSMEDAIEKCDRGCVEDICRERPGLFEWDSAVAYYSGSALDLPNDKGEFMFGFADERCVEFRTCGESAKETVGYSQVNYNVFELFNRGQKEIMDGNCMAARQTKEAIEGLMVIPLIQGALRYAHMVMGEMVSGNIERHNAEASIFALSVLPMIHDCNPLDAQIIHEHLKPKDTTNVDYQVVKHAFEKNYRCMNIKCQQVGGIYHASNNTYFWDSPPCIDLEVELTEKEQKWAAGVGATALVLLALGVLVCCVRRCGKGKSASDEDVQLNVHNGAEAA